MMCTPGFTRVRKKCVETASTINAAMLTGMPRILPDPMKSQTPEPRSMLASSLVKAIVTLL